MIQKEAGGDIIGRLAGLVSRPFVGAARSQAIQNNVQGGITRTINQPIENALRRVGFHGAVKKFYQYGSIPIPGTPKLVQPIMKDPAQRAAYGLQKADNVTRTIAHNPEVIGALASPIPGTAEAYLAGKHLLGRALGIKKVAAFREELLKIAEVSSYQQKTQWSCSASCLKAVLEHWETPISELEAIAVIGTKKGKGAETHQIAEAARKLGFIAFEYSFESIEQAKILLDQNIPIICDIQSFNHPGKGHYVVMVNANNEMVSLMDPNHPGNWRSISIKDMNKRWWDRAMEPPHQLMPKWGIVIVPQEDPNEFS